MELLDIQANELKKHTRANPTGIKAEDLYKLCVSFDERADFSRGLHMAKQQGIVYQVDGLYFYVDADTPPPVQKTAPAVVRATSAPLPQIKKPEQQIQQSSTKTRNGNLAIGTLSAKVAMIYWRLADDPARRLISIRDIKEILRIGEATARKIVIDLWDGDYLSKIKADGAGYVYRWSHHYDYPCRRKYQIDEDEIEEILFPKNKIGNSENVKSLPTDGGSGYNENTPTPVVNDAVCKDSNSDHVVHLGSDSSDAGKVDSSGEVGDKDSLATEKERIEQTLKQIEFEIDVYQKCIDRLKKIKSTLIGE